MTDEHALAAEEYLALAQRAADYETKKRLLDAAAACATLSERGRLSAQGQSDAQ